MDFLVCHYGEIGLKGKNRKFFEEKLVENIKLALEPAYFEFVKRISGRIIVKLTEEGAGNKDEIRENLRHVFGIAYFGFAKSVEQNVETIKRAGVELLENKMFQSFKIDTKRSNKEFHTTSQKVNEEVGAYVLDATERDIQVDLDNPDATLFIEIVETYVFLYLEKIQGQGGLPVGVSGKAISLISGGIDSPVASYLTLKRGMKLVYVHFHAHPYTSKASVEKVKKLVEKLKKYQPKSKLYLIPFAEAQKEVVLNSPAKLRMVLYRRLMFKISEKVARKENAKALVTGENLAQVASQTIENMSVIERAAELIVLRPLLGYDKNEIIEGAKEIGTYKISIEPYEDCCSRFVPDHPETKAKPKEVEQAEENINTEELVEEAIKKSSSLEL